MSDDVPFDPAWPPQDRLPWESDLDLARGALTEALAAQERDRMLIAAREDSELRADKLEAEARTLREQADEMERQALVAATEATNLRRALRNDTSTPPKTVMSAHGLKVEACRARIRKLENPTP